MAIKSNNWKMITAIIIMMHCLPLGVQAVELQVPSQYPTIQEAINDANDGDIVIVSPGRYYENINFNGKNITVRSVDPNDPQVVNNTIIDGSQPVNPDKASVVIFENGETRNAIIKGFTLTGGTGTKTASTHNGGGIFCSGASPTVSHNILTGNSASKSGGAILGRLGSNLLVYKNVIINNNADFGGAIYTYEPVEFYNNIVCDNSARLGGGVYFSGESQVINNLIYNNQASVNGGGLYLHGANLSNISNNTIVGNSSITKGANLDIQFTDNIRVTNNIIAFGKGSYGVYGYSNSLFIFMYNDVWNNEGGNYVGMSDPTGIDGNISVDPVFVAPDVNDYHLQAVSPCINTGDPGDPTFWVEPRDPDIDGQPRIIGGRIDIGADEFFDNVGPVADAGPDQLMSDIPPLITLDGSGSSDPENDDLTYHWQQLEGPGVDLNDSNVVNPTFVPLEFGIYVFQLVVNDGWTDSLPDTVGVVVGNKPPVADAGPDRYAEGRIVFDGTASYDPEGYGVFTYHWEQISGPTANIIDFNTPTPTIYPSYTDEIRFCEFALVVSDGHLASEPDIVGITIVPFFSGYNTLEQVNPPFDPNKPTILGFGGGYDCGHGVKYNFSYKTSFWYEKANIMTTTDDWYGNRYQNYGDMLIVFLSSQAPDYKQPIQTIGFSAGNGLAIDVANYINLTYADARYAVNHVTLLDAACGDYPARVSTFLGSSVGGEPCLVDNYMATHGPFCPGALNVRFPTVPPDRPWDEWWGVYHAVPRRWYEKSSDQAGWVNGDIFNGGVTAGAYVSVAGPAKNLQLAPGSSKYYFKWSGEEPDDESDGVPDTLLFFDESSYPGRLPEPVTLIGPGDGDTVDANGAVFSCEVSENTVGYELLFGRDPYSVSRYMLICETASPPNEVITEFPFEKTYWTIKVRDQYGSTIYADPICIRPEHITPPTRVIENLTTGETYDHIQTAIDDAAAGDELVLRPGISSYPENIDFKGKKLTLRSIDPNDPNVVANTVINGGNWKAALTFANGEDTTCTVDGLTITGGSSGIHCSGTDTMPKITNCLVTASNGAGIELTDRGEAMIENCLITANSGAGVEQTDGGAIIENSIIVENQADGVQGTLARLMITNCTIAANAGTGIKLIDSSAKVTNCIIWLNSGVAIDYDEIIRVRAAYSNIQGGFPGEGNIDTDPCFAGPANRDYHLQSQVGRWNPSYQTWVTDANTSPCIDAGDPDSDWRVELWPHGKWINMGAYGGTPEASMSLSTVGNIADLNNDGTVNLPDFAIVADTWDIHGALLPEDLNRDGCVNTVDLGIFVDNWLWQQ